MPKAVIIDDEAPSVRLLSLILARFYPEINIIGTAHKPEMGRELLQKTSPDLLFLDVELSGPDGFSLLQSVPDLECTVILISGFHAADLPRTDPRIHAVLEKPLAVHELKRVLNDLGLNENKELEGLTLTQNSGSELIRFEEVAWIEAQRSYARIHFRDGSKKLVSRPLSEFEKVAPSYFFRIHRSCMVNAKEVAELDKGRGGMIRLRDGTELTIAYRRKAAFRELIEKF